MIGAAKLGRELINAPRSLIVKTEFTRVEPYRPRRSASGRLSFLSRRGRSDSLRDPLDNRKSSAARPMDRIGPPFCVISDVSGLPLGPVRQSRSVVAGP